MVQVRQEAATAAIVRVGNGIARGGALASDFADAGHKLNLYDQLVTECRFARTVRWGRALYQPQRVPASQGPPGLQDPGHVSWPVRRRPAGQARASSLRGQYTRKRCSCSGGEQA